MAQGVTGHRSTSIMSASAITATPPSPSPAHRAASALGASLLQLLCLMGPSMPSPSLQDCALWAADDLTHHRTERHQRRTQGSVERARSPAPGCMLTKFGARGARWTICGLSASSVGHIRGSSDHERTSASNAGAKKPKLTTTAERATAQSQSPRQRQLEEEVVVRRWMRKRCCGTSLLCMTASGLCQVPIAGSDLRWRSC